MATASSLECTPSFIVMLRTWLRTVCVDDADRAAITSVGMPPSANSCSTLRSRAVRSAPGPWARCTQVASDLGQARCIEQHGSPGGRV